MCNYPLRSWSSRWERSRRHASPHPASGLSAPVLVEECQGQLFSSFRQPASPTLSPAIMATTYAPNATLNLVVQAAPNLEVTQEREGANGRTEKLNVTQKTSKGN